MFFRDGCCCCCRCSCCRRHHLVMVWDDDYHDISCVISAACDIKKRERFFKPTWLAASERHNLSQPTHVYLRFSPPFFLPLAFVLFRKKGKDINPESMNDLKVPPFLSSFYLFYFEILAFKRPFRSCSIK